MLFNKYCNNHHPKPDSDFSIQSRLIPLTFMNLLLFRQDKSKRAAYDDGGKLFKTSSKTGASKESERTPVWKAPVKEESPVGYLSQTLKQKGFYPFNISKVTLNTS